MPKIPRSILKTFFEKGDKPAQVHFEALIDSLVHVTDDRGLIGLRNYDTSLSYVPGDAVLLNGNLYQCNTACTGSFTPAYWNLLQALGSVVYMGTWSAASNAPVLSDATGIKGNYYVASDAGTLNLGSGNLEWGTGDWIIHNGTIWEKVDNSEDNIAADIVFTPDGDITAVNVQDAITEVRNDTNTKLGSKSDKVAGATSGNFAGLSASGNVTDSSFSPEDFLYKENTITYVPSADFHPATKKYVDDITTGMNISAKSDKVTGGACAGKFAGLDASGNLTDSGMMPSDFIHKTNTTAYIPAASYHPATKKYVDDTTSALGVLNKADKVTGGTSSGKFAGLNASGNLTDSGKSPADYLDKTNTTIYTPSADYHPATKKYVDDRVQRLIVSFTFPTSFQTGNVVFTAIDLQNIVPAGSDIFPHTSDILARLRVEYLCETATTGQAGLLNYSDYVTGTPVEVPGSSIELPFSASWRQAVSSEFKISGAKNYKIIFRVASGTRKVRIQGATLTLKYF